MPNNLFKVINTTISFECVFSAISTILVTQASLEESSNVATNRDPSSNGIQVMPISENHSVGFGLVASPLSLSMNIVYVKEGSLNVLSRESKGV